MLLRKTLRFKLGSREIKQIRLLSHIITDQELEFYKENGYVVVKENISLSDVDRYKQRFVDIVNGKCKKPPTMTVMKDIELVKKVGKKSGFSEETVTKLQDFQDEPGIYAYCREKSICDNVSRLIGNSFYSIHTMLINKPSDLGKGSSRHPPHQDLLYFPLRPEDKICATWTALQHIDKENGCLYVYPGSHRECILYPHGYPNDGVVNKAYHGIQDHSQFPAENRVDVIMEAGDTVYFHPLLVHGSGPNNSANFRKAISCHYAASDCTMIDVRGTVQEEIAAEVQGMLLHKHGFKLSYPDIWRFKSKHVQGKTGEAFTVSSMRKLYTGLRIAISSYRDKKEREKRKKAAAAAAAASSVSAKQKP